MPDDTKADAPSETENLGYVSTEQLARWRSILTGTAADPTHTIGTLCAIMRELLTREITHPARKHRDKAEAHQRAVVGDQGIIDPEPGTSADLLPPTQPSSVLDNPPD
jgi:hypothetical protein